MSVNRASEVWKEIKPFAIRDMNSMLDSKAGDSGDDLYAIILYDESAQKIKYYSMSSAGLAGALGASESGDIVWIPAGTIDFSNIQSIVSTVGAEKCLVIAPGDPLPENWEDSSFDDSSWTDSVLGDETILKPLTGSQRVTKQTGHLANQSIMLFRRKFIIHFPIPQISVKADNYVDELYLNEVKIFQNGANGATNNISLTSDASFIGENLIAAKVRNANSATTNPMFLSYVIEFQQIDYAIPAGVEVVGLGKNTIIDSAVENNGILTNIQVTGTISGSGISRMVSNPTFELFSNQIKSLIGTGTSPFSIASTTVNTNLNADLLDGEHADAFADASHTHSESDITDLDHDAVKIDGIDVDLTGIADGEVLVYDSYEDKLVPGEGGGASLTVEEVDESPSVVEVEKIIFPNGSVTDNLDGSVSVGFPSGLTVQEIDETPSVANVSVINITNGTLTDDGGGEITIDFGSAATDGSAIHDNQANEISAITEKETPADDDLLLIEDSAASYVKKSVKISNLPAGSGSGETDVLMVQVFT
jgi:hypothetical protein